MRASFLTSTSILGALLNSLATFAAEAPRKISFEREGVIYTASLDGKGVKKLTRGDLPQISPDGASVAYNTNESSDKLPVRHIAIADVASGKVTLLKSIPSDNNTSPVWSPDGKSLLFNTFENDDWQLAFVNADNTGYRIVKKSGTKGDPYYEPTWAADGKSFFCHDLDAVYQFNLDGRQLKKWAIHSIVENGDMSSNSRLSVSPDGKSLLMEIEMGEEHNRNNWEGPPPSLWLLPLDAKKATRLTRKNHFAWDCTWISNDEFLFLSQGPKEKTRSLYRGSVKGGDYKFILKDANTPSVTK